MHLGPRHSDPVCDNRRAGRRRLTIILTTTLGLIAADMWVRGRAGELDQFYVDEYERKDAALRQCAAPPAIVLMGSSRAAYGLVPEEFEQATGRRVFNFAIPASKVVEWQIMAERYLASLQPELVVLGINVSEVRADLEPVSAARNLFTLPDVANYLMTDGWSNIVVGHFLERRAGAAWALFHRRFEVMNWLQERVDGLLPKHAQHARERRMIASRPCPDDGYEHPWLQGKQLESLDARLRDDPSAVIRVGTPVFDSNARALDRFRDLLEWFKGRSVRVVVVYLPNSPAVEARWGEGEARVERTIAAACRDAGVLYVPSPMSVLPRTNADFLDETHMGLPLARRISRSVVERVLALGLLTPKPGVTVAQQGAAQGRDFETHELP